MTVTQQLQSTNPGEPPPESAPQTELVSPQEAQLLLPKLSDEQLDVLRSYGTEEPIVASQVLSAAGDPSYDLMVILGGEVTAFDCHAGKRREIVRLRARDFIAELNLLTGQTVYVTSEVTQPGSLLRVPRQAVRLVIDEHPDLGELLLQTMFRRRQAFLQIDAGLQIIGSRFSPDTQRLREFAARNRLAYAWVDLDRDAGASELVHDLGFSPRQTPVVILGGNAVVANPSNVELADAVGIADEPPTDQVFDLLVVGAGPAGLAASVYGSSEGLATATIDAVAPGGQAATTSRIENYLGFPSGVSGEEFGERAHLQALKFGTHLMVAHAAVSLSRPDGYFELTIEDESRLLAKSVILAAGVHYRRLDISGIERFEGLGVTYSPMDAERDLEDDEPAVIVGGGNSAGQAALHFAGIGHRVYLVVRGRGLAPSMSSYLMDRIAHDARITTLFRTAVSEVHGQGRLESVVTRNLDTKAETQFSTHALCLLTGAEPRTDWLAGVVERDNNGFVVTGPALSGTSLATNDWRALGRDPFLLETSLPGVFAAGDIRANSIKRVASAAGEGSMAARFVQQYLEHADQYV